MLPGPVLLWFTVGLAPVPAATSPCEVGIALTAALEAGDHGTAARVFTLLAADAGRITADEPCLPIVEAALSAYAQEAHRQAQALGKLSDHEAANLRYAVLRRLPRTDGRTRTDFLHAELLWDMGRFREAGALYKAVVDADPRGEHARTAAFNRVLAAEQELRGAGPSFVGGVRTEPVDRARAPGPALRLTFERKVIAACDDAIAVMEPLVGDEATADPGALEELRVVHLKAAALRRGPGHTGAVPRLRAVSVRWPASEEGRDAALLLLELLWSTHQRGEFTAELERISSTVADDDAFGAALLAWRQKLDDET